MNSWSNKKKVAMGKVFLLITIFYDKNIFTGQRLTL